MPPSWNGTPEELTNNNILQPTLQELTRDISSNPDIDIHLDNSLDTVQTVDELSVPKHAGNQ